MTAPSQGAKRAVALGHRLEDLRIEREVLARHGIALHDAGSLDDAAAIEAARDADAVLLGAVMHLDAEAISALRSCRVIARYGIGVDNVDLVAARAQGITVTVVRDYAVEEVSNHALALALALHRRLPQYDGAVRAGQWGSRAWGIPRLSTCTFGVVGLGAIGRAVARKARPFVDRVIGSDPLAAADQARDVDELVDLGAVLAGADIISLHLPLTPGTRGLIGAREICEMKDGAILVNASRGGIVDEEALRAALASGKLGGAGLDTTVAEPLPADDPLLRAPNLLVTPHVAWQSAGAREDLQRCAAEEVVSVLTGRRPRFAV